MKNYVSFLFFLAILTLCYGRRGNNPCKGFSEVPCDNGECISKFHWCSFGPQCSDDSDEKYCRSDQTINCTDKHFICANEKCIPISLRCDGSWDCFDNSDEENCDTIDQDESAVSERNYDFHSTTSTPEVYTTLSDSTDYYRIQTRRSHNSRYYDHPPTPSPSPTDYNVDYDSSVRQYFNSRYSAGRFDSTDSYTYSGGEFSGIQQPSSNSHRADTTSGRRSYGQPTTRTSQNSGRSHYPNINREHPVVHPPRFIVYPPRTMSLSLTRSSVRRLKHPHFNFIENYTEYLEYSYKRNIQKAKDWVLGQRDDSYTWGRDTPRALIALSLISNSFKSDVDDNELMKKGFQSHLGLKLLRNETGLEKISTTRLALYINALIATCQNPHNFFGIDLVDVLFQTQHLLEQHQQFVNPLIYLTLCLANKNVPVSYLETFLRRSFQTEISKDLHILATTAMACVAQQNPHDRYIRDKLEKAVESLLTQMNPVDGSFGSKYSTALAAQALMSVNDTSRIWDYQRTLGYLAREQLPDGSFGDMQLTYYTILALSGRSLLHLRNTVCDPDGDDKKEWSPEDILNKEGPRKSVSYTLRVGYPETYSIGIQLSVPMNTNFFDIMRVAAHLDSRFKFNYEYSGRQLGIHTIANIPNDPERGMFWTLYKLPSSSPSIDFRRKYTGDPGTLNPEDGDELLFWYLSDFLSY